MVSQARRPSGRVLDFFDNILDSNLSLPDERSNHETSRRIVFYRVHLVSHLRPIRISLYIRDVPDSKFAG